MARRRFTRFAIKFAKVAQMIEEAHRSFMAMEKRAETYREKAVDQQETFQDIAADVYALGDANLEAQRRVEELIHDIASAFKTIVAYLEPMMK